MNISVIIPTHNRADTLRLTLTSLTNFIKAKGFEVIIIDNGSTDSTSKVCSDFTSKFNHNFKYYFAAEPGLLTGRQLGASLAKGEVICFLDDDVEVSETWLTGVENAFSNPNVHLATGPCLPRYMSIPPLWINYFWNTVTGLGKTCTWLSLLDFGNTVAYIHPNFVWGLNFCIRKETLIKLGGFHPDNIPPHLQMYQGDGETGLTMKAAKQKLKALYHPNIKVHHIINSERLTLEYFKKRAFYQGVCNSFTLLRRQYLHKDEKATKFELVKKILGSIKKRVTEYKMQFSSKKVNHLKNVLKLEELAGFNYHQEVFNKNSKVRDWVLKPDYWDYKLP